PNIWPVITSKIDCVGSMWSWFNPRPGTVCRLTTFRTPSTYPDKICDGDRSMIQLIHVSKFYNRRAALADVTLEIEKGEFVMLMRPSGSAKSTWVWMLIGAEQPDDRHVFVQGKNVTNLKSSEIPYLRRKVATVFQDFRLLPKKSVFDNVALPLVVQGASSSD